MARQRRRPLAQAGHWRCAQITRRVSAAATQERPGNKDGHNGDQEEAMTYTLAFHVLVLVLVAVAMALSLAHALELPGKMRLSKDIYVGMQAIYYPGFTYGGLVGEFGGMLGLAALLFLLPAGSGAFWWAALGLALLIVSHAVYWIVTHPVNGFWLKDTELSGLGAMFFPTADRGRTADWTQLRNVWEYSHVARAALALLSFVAVAFSLAFRSYANSSSI
jgi:hypothetical protein